MALFLCFIIINYNPVTLSNLKFIKRLGDEGSLFCELAYGKAFQSWQNSQKTWSLFDLKNIHSQINRDSCSLFAWALASNYESLHNSWINLGSLQPAVMRLWKSPEWISQSFLTLFPKRKGY